MVSLSAVNTSIRKHQILELKKKPTKNKTWNCFILDFSIQILIFKSISVIFKSFDKKKLF